MIQRFIKKTQLKISDAIAFGKRKSAAFLPRKHGKKSDKVFPVTSEAVEPAAKKENEAVEAPVKDLSASGEEKKKRKKKVWKPEDFEVEIVPGKVRFHDIGFPPSILRAIADLEYEYCTPVQAESLPHLLEGKDLVANANTGTGKTAVFLITILSYLLREKKEGRRKGVRALIIAPTRELVIQIAKDGKRLAKYTPLRIVSIYGGADFRRQQELLEKGRCDIIAATPGRLLDFVGRRILDLKNCDIMVIDEADRMLDMGFIPDVRRIIHQLPDRGSRQTLMFSATITDEVKRLASQWCKKPVNIVIEPEKVAVETVEQIVYLVTKSEKYAVLYNLIEKSLDGRIAVFANQKIEAKRLADRLQRNRISCTLLTGDVPQNKRMERLERFRSGKVKVLVATDVAGRGIHIDGITHVINYTLPYEPEDYVHRIGRTGRAGADGISISFACEEGGFVLPDIEEFIGRKLDCVVPDEDLFNEPPKADESKPGGGHSSSKKKYRGSGNRGKPRYTKRKKTT